MIRLLLLSIIIVIASSCKKNIEPVDKPETIITDDRIMVTGINPKNSSAGVKDKYHLLGYGYDVTKEFADSSAAKHRVVDVQKMAGEHPQRVNYSRSNTTGAHVIATANALDFSEQISHRIKQTNGSAYFKGAITSYFPASNGLSGKYVYANYSYKLQHRRVKFMATDEAVDYIIPAFKSDIQISAPEEIVKKYGTHVLTDIDLGARLNVSYQAETSSPDRVKAANLGLTVALSQTFGLLSGLMDFAGATSATGNFSQKLSYKTSGGDPSKLLPIPHPTSKLPIINIGGWHQSSTVENAELIDIHEIFPIYQLILDPVKRAAVKNYVDQYLIDNRVHLAN